MFEKKMKNMRFEVLIFLAGNDIDECRIFLNQYEKEKKRQEDNGSLKRWNILRVIMYKAARLRNRTEKKASIEKKISFEIFFLKEPD